MKVRSRRVLVAMAALAVMLVSDVLVADTMTEEAGAVRPVIVVIELNATSPFQDGNMAWVQSGPSVLDGQGDPIPITTSTIEGRVTVYKVARLLRQKIFVTLQARSDDADMLIPDPFPRDMEFSAISKIETRSFKLSITLANPNLPYSTADEFPKKIIIDGTWMAMTNVGAPNSEGTIEPCPVYVRIRPFYYLVMYTDPPTMRMAPGQTKVVDLVIKNMGNAHDRYDIDIPNEAALASRGWVVEMNRTSIVVPPMSEGRVRVKVTSPRAFHSIYHMGTQSFVVHAASFNTRQLVERGDLMMVTEYQTDIQVQMLGPDFLYVPGAWAFLLFFILMLVLFNFGINIFTLRKRRIKVFHLSGEFPFVHRIDPPVPKDPGFIYLAKRIGRGRRTAGREVVKGPERKVARPFAMKERGPPAHSRSESRHVVDLRSRDTASAVRAPPGQGQKRKGFGFGRGMVRQDAGRPEKGRSVKGLHEILEDL